VKLSKGSLLLLAVGLAIVIFTSLGVARAQQLKEQDRVNEELALVTRRLNIIQLAQLYSQYEELENQMSQTTSQLEAARAVLIQPIGSIDSSDTLFSIADSCNVEVMEMALMGPPSNELEGITCSVLAFSIGVEGYVPSLINFVNRVNSDFVTGTVESVNIHVSDNTTEQRSAAKIRLIIYSYQGD